MFRVHRSHSDSAKWWNIFPNFPHCNATFFHKFSIKEENREKKWSHIIINANQTIMSEKIDILSEAKYNRSNTSELKMYEKIIELRISAWECTWNEFKLVAFMSIAC